MHVEFLVLIQSEFLMLISVANGLERHNLTLKQHTLAKSLLIAKLFQTQTKDKLNQIKHAHNILYVSISE